MNRRELEDMICADCVIICDKPEYCNAYYVVKKFADILDRDKVKELIQEK